MNRLVYRPKAQAVASLVAAALFVWLAIGSDGLLRWLWGIPVVLMVVSAAQFLRAAKRQASGA